MFQKGLNNETPAVRWFSFSLQKCLGSTEKTVYAVGNPGCRLKLGKTAACRHPGKLKFPATGSGPGVSVQSSRGTKVFL